MDTSYRLKQDLQVFIMLLVLVALMVVGLYLASALAKATLPLFFGISDVQALFTDAAVQLRHPVALLYAQAITSSIGFFLLPTMLYHVIFSHDMAGTIGIRRMPPIRYWLLGIGIIACGGIFIELLVALNSAIPLSVQWASLRSTQAAYEGMITAFFSETGVARFAILTLVLCLLPAIAEEVCFRGTIQPLLSRTNLGPIWGVVFTGLMFSLFHGEFNNFLAIWCMGIVLGLIYYYTDSIWVCIAAHFFNNFMGIAFKFAYMRGWLHSDVAACDTLPLYITLPAGLAMIYGLIVLRKWTGKTPVKLF